MLKGYIVSLILLALESENRIKKLFFYQNSSKLSGTKSWNFADITKNITWHFVIFGECS